MKIVEIFKSIDGEGITAGYPATFIRTYGCNMTEAGGCSYCDTGYSWNGSESPIQMDVTDILNKVIKLGCKRVTLTGGEPLLQMTDARVLIDRLLENGFQVNIETNGSIDIDHFVQLSKVIVTMDYKCPSSNVEHMMKLTNLAKLRETDVLKFVVGSQDDLECVRNLCLSTKAQIFISPVFGKIEPKDIVAFMLEHNLYNCRVQLQLHKYIWPVDKRGV